MLYVCLTLLTGWCGQLESLRRDSLEWSQNSSARFDSVGRGDNISPLLAGVSSWVWMFPNPLAGRKRPSGHVDLLATRDIEGFHKRVHVLPAVQLSEAADVSIGNGHESVA